MYISLLITIIHQQRSEAFYSLYGVVASFFDDHDDDDYCHHPPPPHHHYHHFITMIRFIIMIIIIVKTVLNSWSRDRVKCHTIVGGCLIQVNSLLK